MLKTSPTTHAGGRRRVLIRWALREVLEAKGKIVNEAVRRRRRAFFAATGRPDAVVLDYRLPDSNDLGRCGNPQARPVCP
jgi:DNA-binding NarL/FixJ family response regulator